MKLFFTRASELQQLRKEIEELKTANEAGEKKLAALEDTNKNYVHYYNNFCKETKNVWTKLREFNDINPKKEIEIIKAEMQSELKKIARHFQDKFDQTSVGKLDALDKRFTEFQKEYHGHIQIITANIDNLDAAQIKTGKSINKTQVEIRKINKFLKSITPSAKVFKLKIKK